MAERKESQFQPNTFLSCTGKVAGFLNHDTMVHPPQPTEDYVFIVVPDAWKFHDKTPRESFSISPSSMTVGKKSPADPHGRKEFQSPPKRTTPSKRSNESQNPTAVSTPQKKARIVPSEEQSSIITSEAPLDPSPGPHQHTDPPMQMKEGQEPISPPKGATPSKRSNECHSPTAISTPPKRFVQCLRKTFYIYMIRMEAPSLRWKNHLTHLLSHINTRIPQCKWMRNEGRYELTVDSFGRG